MLRCVFVCLLGLYLASCTSDQALQRAVGSLDDAVYSGNKAPQSAVRAYGALYQRYPDDPIAIGAYANALSEVGKDRQAAAILRPFIGNKDMRRIPAPVFIAYMRLLLNQGNDAEAAAKLHERMRLPVIMMKYPASAPQVSNLLGLALTHEKEWDDAAQAFEYARVHWDGRHGIVERNIDELNRQKLAAMP